MNVNNYGLDFNSIAEAWQSQGVIECMKQAIEAYKASLPNSNAGRKASEETRQLRESIAKYLQVNCLTTHTTKELSSKFNATQIEINMALSYLEKQGKAQRVGKKTDHGQGRPLTLWKAR